MHDGSQQQDDARSSMERKEQLNEHEPQISPFVSSTAIQTSTDAKATRACLPADYDSKAWNLLLRMLAVIAMAAVAAVAAAQSKAVTS
jgi:hypothetical protein